MFRTQEYWDEHRIDVVKNERIIRIDKNDDGSGVAHSMSAPASPSTGWRWPSARGPGGCCSTASTCPASSTSATPTTPSNSRPGYPTYATWS
ncbi:hypothetical protein ACR6C2_44740 [Streptomyces sp. INA 01156]